MPSMEVSRRENNDVYETGGDFQSDEMSILLKQRLD